MKKSSENIRIATWNVNYFLRDSIARNEMFEQIRNIHADVFCMEEFFSRNNNENEKIIRRIATENGFQFYYQNNVDNQQVIGNIIFSKYPIVNHSAEKYISLTAPDQLLSVDLSINHSIVRIYATHLQSNLFDLEEKAKIDSLKKNQDRNYIELLHIAKKLCVAEKVRSTQADNIDINIRKSQYPTIFCGDCNDVPNAYVYYTIKGNMQDAFLNKGFGIGRTYNDISPTLRIDFVFADKNFTVQQVKRYTNKLSDHYMYVCDLAMKK